MASFMAASVWMKIALVCLLLGTVLYVIGFATVNWMVHTGYNYKYQAWGLWNVVDCPGTRAFCTQVSIARYHWSLDFVRAVQALEVLGLVCDLVALLVLILYMFADQCRRRNALIAVIVFIFAAVFFIIVGIAVYGIKMDSHGYSVGWSMGIAIVGAIFMFISGIMCILQSIGR